MTQARNPQLNSYDVIILGAGAAGLMCAAVAGQRGRSVLVLEQARRPGEKIRISGGGRCNFTNLHASPANFLSANPRFCHSALSGYTQRDFIALVESYGIVYHEKTRGQLFCDGSSQQIIDMLLEECRKAVGQCLAGAEDPKVALRVVPLHDVAEKGTKHTSVTDARRTGHWHLARIVAKVRQVQIAQQQPAVSVWIGTHSPRADGREFGQFRD